MTVRDPHREAYYEEGGILGKDKPKQIHYTCLECSKPVRKKEMFVSNDAGKRWHLHCVMRSESYYKELVR